MSEGTKGKGPRVKIVVSGKYVKRLPNKKGYVVIMPPDTLIAGVIDLGGARFIVKANQVRPYNFDPTAIEIHVYANHSIRLALEDGTETSAMPSAVKAAIAEQYRKQKSK